MLVKHSKSQEVLKMAGCLYTYYDDKWKAPNDYENLNHLKSFAHLMREGDKKRSKV